MFPLNSFHIQSSVTSCEKFNKFHDWECIRRDKGGTQEICKRCGTIVYANKGINNAFDNNLYANLHNIDFLQPEDFKRETENSLNY